tara:strand:- start:78 stop:347 length:270 start_codon:yes stop_codon:yes gene_type:complete
MSEVKFNNDELKKVQDIRQSYMNIHQSFGQLKIAQLKLEEQETELNSTLKKIESDETSFLSEITKKYGDGTLNPETGVFTPITPENKSE